jgi:3-hydroxyisobutyrate dehydrogenase
MQIGIAGVGRMGEAIGLRLIECGHTLTVWNRSAGKTEALEKAGAKVVKSPAEVAAASEAVITILIDADAIAAVYDGRSGLLSGDVSGKLFIDMSTVLPEDEQALARRVRAKGAGFAECPVGGTIGPARQGKLIGLLGADDADALRARPILEQLCRRVDHVGAVGAGAQMKLAINLPLLVFWQAFGEALSLCRDVTLDPDKMIELFADTSGGPNVLKARGALLAAVLAGGAKGTPGFDIDGGRKDLRTMVAEAKGRGLELPLTERAIACFDEASRAGWGKEDNTFLPVYWLGRKKT